MRSRREGLRDREAPPSVLKENGLPRAPGPAPQNRVDAPVEGREIRQRDLVKTSLIVSVESSHTMSEKSDIVEICSRTQRAPASRSSRTADLVSYLPSIGCEDERQRRTAGARAGPGSAYRKVQAGAAARLTATAARRSRSSFLPTWCDVSSDSPVRPHRSIDRLDLQVVTVAAAAG